MNKKKIVDYILKIFTLLIYIISWKKIENYAKKQLFHVLKLKFLIPFRFDSGKSDKHILDYLLNTERYDKRFLPPSNGKLKFFTKYLLWSLINFSNIIIFSYILFKKPTLIQLNIDQCTVVFFNRRKIWNLSFFF